MAPWLAGALCLLAWLAIWIWRYPDQPGPARPAAVTVEIPSGAGLVAIDRLLVQARVVERGPLFVLWVKLSGAGRHLKAGEYAFTPGMTPRAVWREIAAGRTVRHAITLPEGSTIYQAADLIVAGGWGSREDFLRLMTEPGLIRGLGLDVPSLEGYLFPDTYFFEKGTSLPIMVTAMVRHMDQVLDREEAAASPEAALGGNGGEGVVVAHQEEGRPGHLSRHQVLILASIIEKETALETERPLVAKVFLNRLRQGMKLQADPTVIYGALKFGQPLTKADLETPTPFNTYTNAGLPAGPICNPGRTSIAAVLHPSSEEVYYFVSQNDGSHYFSKTLAEHNQAVSRYRKKKFASGD